MVLLESTMRRSKVYVELFELLSRHKYGLRKQEACKLLGGSASQFAKAVDEVVRCGYVREYRNLSKPNHPKYLMLVDPFILFHFSLIEPRDGVAPRRWSDFVADQGRYNAWRGNAFEIVCLYHVDQIKGALGIGGVQTKEYPWHSARRDGGAQIDLVIERADRIVNLCEMKFTDLPYELSRAHEQELARKREVFADETGTRLALKSVLVCASGTSGYHDGTIAKIITAEDLLRA